ncbi:metallophosphoesterase [Peptoniphilus sp. oral taxon 386]|uniref:metallophosphoesterase family protein n=1 Tax=Peptoniphilus sp. oral taxon 386 TaxID=652713 RepID=UPI0001DA9D3B|nr:metallophosphoesterase [Peptoniphilus sp. oral taxon 386]EFI42287.1 Ser/Thr phosphatase family protein [Peptoniphilus sp. oral taxon 386 str. F0131]
MKFLYFTDTHLRATNPINRIDNFFETLKTKLNEVVNISIEENVDYILHGGDLFDRPDTSISVVSDFSKIFQKFNVPIYIVSGNHDIFGHNPKTLNRTMLGLLCNLGILNLVNDKKIILKKDISVQLTAYPYTFGMDDDINKSNYLVLEKNPEADYMIHMTHGFLIDRPFIKNIPHTLISEISSTFADITLGAHYHYGFKTTEINGKYFVNPGSIVRISNSQEEIKRKPKVVIIELNDKISIKDIYLKNALDGNLVLDRSEMERHKFKQNQIYEFKEIIDSSTELNNLDIYEILIKIATNEFIDDNIKKEAIKRIQNIQIKGADFS